MITVKEYAKERGITIQAVHKSMSGKRKADRLVGHVEVIDGVKWLDDEAVAILDESRNQAPTVILGNERAEEIEQLRSRIHELEERIERKDLLYERLQERVDKREAALLEAESKMKLIEEKSREQVGLAVKEAEDKLSNELNAKHRDELQKMNAEHQKEVQELQNKLDQERSKTFWQRLFGR